MNKEEVIQAIKKAAADFKAVQLEDLKIVVIGGGAIMMKGISSRTTGDVDSFKLLDGELKGFISPERDILYAYEINSGPYDSMEELTKCLSLEKEFDHLHDFGKISVYTPTVEQLMLSKVLSIVTRDTTSSTEKKDQDIDDLNLLIEYGYDKTKIASLAKKWIATIKETNAVWADLFENKYIEYMK